MNIENVSRRIVRGILQDLTDRRGLRHEWDRIDEDIRKEIVDVWEKVASTELRKELSQ